MEVQPKIPLLKVREFGDVINDTLTFVKLNYKPVLKVVVILVLPLLIFGSFFGSFIFTSYFEAITNISRGVEPGEAFKAMIGSGGSILLAYLGFGLASICLSLTIIELFIRYETSADGNVEASELFDGIKRSFGRYFGFLLATIGIALLIVIVLGLVIAMLIAIKIIALLFLLVPVLMVGIFYLAIAMIFAPFIFIRENTGVIDAYKRSFQLVKGFWWQTFGVVLVISFIVNFASMIFIIPFYSIYFANFFNSITHPGQTFEMTIWSKLSSMFMLCGTTVMGGIVYVAVYMQYYSLVERKEGEDIMKQIDNLNTPETPTV